MIRRFNRLGLIAIIPTILAGSQAQAEISYKDLKGVHEWIKPEYGAYSPIYGYTLLGSESGRNYRFLGNYGPKNKEHGCMGEVPAYQNGFTTPDGHRVPGLVEREDCPQDFNAEWTQRLFPSADGQIFSENGAEPDLISHLTPELIGKLLNRIAKVKDSDLTDDKESKQLETGLQNLLFEALSPGEFKTYLSELEHKKKKEAVKAKQAAINKIEYQLKTCNPDDKDKLQPQLEQLQSEMAELTEKLTPRSGSPDGSRSGSDSSEDSSEVVSGTRRKQIPTEPKGRWKEGHFKSVARILVGALKESRGKDAAYPRHLPEQQLLEFFLKKFNSKEDILSLFRGMPDLLKDHKILNDEKAIVAFKTTHWEDSDWKDIPSNAKGAAQHFIKNPEALIFEAKTRAGAKSVVPPIFSFKTNVPHSSLNGGVHGDCGETLIRTLTNFAFYNADTGQFDPKRMDELKEEHPELNFSSSMVEFYKRNPDSTKAGNDKVHADWNENVLSSLSHVNYRQGGAPPVCDMDAGVDNVIKVMDQLFLSRGKGDPTTLSNPKKSRAQRLDELFRLLSRKNAHLNWALKGANPTDRSKSEQEINSKNLDIDLDVRMGENAQTALRSQPIIRLGLTAGHFSVTDLSKSNDPWKGEILKDLISSDELKDESKNDSSLSSILPILIDAETIALIPKKKQTPAHFQALRLNSASDQLSVFKTIVAHPEGKRMKVLAVGLKKKLGTQDIGTVTELAKAEYENNYPFGDLVHSIGKPEAIYKRVNPEILKAKFGENAAKKMGQSWVREMHGHKIAIGEPLLNADGSELKANFEKAKTECLDLNPPTRRAEVEKTFIEREAKLDQLRKTSYSDEAQREKALQDVHHTMPIAGCYLMSKEEWTVLEGDFGYREKNYIPQILPKLDSRGFWSSSGDPDNAFKSFTFNGNFGGVVSLSRGSYESVRCGCVSAAVDLPF